MSVGELTRAVCAVMAECPWVQQTGWNNHNKYHYASDADLLAALQPLMAKHGLALFPHLVESATTQHGTSGRGNTNWRTDVVVTYILSHISGESITIQAPGCGLDQQDKGVYKAMTGAHKYALRELFLIPTGNDAERGKQLQREARERGAAPPRAAAPAAPPVPQETSAHPAQGPQASPTVPDWLEEALTGPNGPWHMAPGEELVETLRDFAAFAMPEGRSFDPFAAGVERLRKLPGWLGSQSEAIQRWLDWRGELEELLCRVDLSTADLRIWCTQVKRGDPARWPEAKRRKLLAELGADGLATCQAWFETAGADR